MALSLTIHPDADVLAMYGELDPSSAYSLSGHISISVTSPFSLFEQRRPARLLLQSVTLTFEGQSEVITPTGGYSGLRLCTVTRELVPSAPIEISNEGHEDGSEPCVWNVMFNLPISGWLPASNAIGTEAAGTSYALYASAKYSPVEEEASSSSWSFLSLCAAPFRYRVRYANARRSIPIVRFVAAPTTEIQDITLLNYLVNSTATAVTKDCKGKARIPSDVLSKIQVLASVPEYVDINDSALPLTLRLRSKDLCEEECQKLQVTEVCVDIVQREKCRYRPSATCLSRFPIPPRRMQPPNLPLRDPHPSSSIYDVAMYVSDLSESVSRTFSLLPPDENGVYALAPNNYVFANDATPRPEGAPQTWYTMDTSIPFVQSTGGGECWGKYDTEEIEYQGLHWAGLKDLRPSTNSPLYTAMHELSVSLTCTYDLEGKGGKVARERLGFKVPVTFARVAPRLATPTVGGTEADALALPVYSQLYDANGERKIDYSTPLPMYTPKADAGDALAPSQDSDASVSAGASASVNTYHGVNSLDLEAGKRHAHVVVAGEHAPNP